MPNAAVMHCRRPLLDKNPDLCTRALSAISAFSAFSPVVVVLAAPVRYLMGSSNFCPFLYDVSNIFLEMDLKFLRASGRIKIE